MKFIINDIELKKLDISAKMVMEKYLLELGEDQVVDISDYTFAANFIWLGNVSGFYATIEDCFCLFAMSGSELSMLLPPLGKLKNLKKAINKCFEIMNSNNSSPHYSRIDYVAQCILEKFAKMLDKNASIFDVFADFIFEKKLVDYIYKADDLISLHGNAYHTKRTEINKFKNTYPNFKIVTLEPEKHAQEIITLSNTWVQNRLKYTPKEQMDDFMEGMYQEKAAIKRMLEYHQKLELMGIVLYIDERLQGYTVGEKINEGVASVLLEKTNFEVLGCAQFIFREFSKILSSQYSCEFINVGDDMGFENLKKVKMSYHPYRLNTKYSIYQKI
ncbi:ribonuclease HII [Campylobacter geochelonis]|uniref:Ribonuclease HII n=2 Tax=Campylobacter geochelonis TaxID=1780362 RepID=A0A128EFL2_9BACT|nr:phosphatidylglycerol lysyltransferase domain-containing protein [Campylobacter geochelonis]QKF71998.1 DUF2156 domain-containing protein [Campylobacter geochelonis]CZE47716.1 ribonuclease HII [Campylobacter geochelonis]